MERRYLPSRHFAIGRCFSDGNAVTSRGDRATRDCVLRYSRFTCSDFMKDSSCRGEQDTSFVAVDSVAAVRLATALIRPRGVEGRWSRFLPTLCQPVDRRPCRAWPLVARPRLAAAGLAPTVVGYELGIVENLPPSLRPPSANAWPQLKGLRDSKSRADARFSSMQTSVARLSYHPLLGTGGPT